MQKHWDVMRTDDAGETWREVSGNLPTDCGFAIDVHAHEPETIFVVPITSDVRYFAAIEHAYTRALRADAGYAQLVQHNPFSPSYARAAGATSRTRCANSPPSSSYHRRRRAAKPKFAQTAGTSRRSTDCAFGRTRKSANIAVGPARHGTRSSPPRRSRSPSKSAPPILAHHMRIATPRPSIRQKVWLVGSGRATTAGTSRGFAPMRLYAANDRKRAAETRRAHWALPVMFGSTRFSSAV